MLTESSRRKDFPALESLTYLNTAAESIPPRCVGEALQAYWADKQRGMQGREAHFAQVEACREVSARLLGLQGNEISFCSCSSEAYNLLASALSLGSSDEIVVTDLDFPAGATPWLRLPAAPVVRLWNSVAGVLNPDDLAPLLTPRTRLVQVSLISFYNGFRLDWQATLKAIRTLAPQALISVDITQAFGRVALNCPGADILISSTHKWTLGIHGGCVIGIPDRNAQSLTTHAGGWYHLTNAFDSDRFQKAIPKQGAASFSVGMPNFVALYALNASLRYLENIGIDTISAHSDPWVTKLHQGLISLGLSPMAPLAPDRPTGIVAFRHDRSSEIHRALESARIQVMHHAGRIRIAVHGYNTQEDVDRFLSVLGQTLADMR